MVKRFKLSKFFNTSMFFIGLTMVLTIANANATPWTYSDEISVAEGYNSVYGTSYNEYTEAGLADLLSDHEGVMQTNWDTSIIQSLTVLAMETSSTKHLFLDVGSSRIDIYDPGAWTPNSRGWQDAPSNPVNIVDIAGTLTSNGYASNSIFQISLGPVTLDASNTYLIEGARPNEFLLAHNGGGLSGTDVDANEPLIWINPTSTPVPEASSSLLLLLGLGGCVLYFRKRKISEIS